MRHEAVCEHTDRQTDRDRQTGRQADTQTHPCFVLCVVLLPDGLEERANAARIHQRHRRPAPPGTREARANRPRSPLSSQHAESTRQGGGDVE